MEAIADEDKGGVCAHGSLSLWNSWALLSLLVSFLVFIRSSRLSFILFRLLISTCRSGEWRRRHGLAPFLLLVGRETEGIRKLGFLLGTKWGRKGRDGVRRVESSCRGFFSGDGSGGPEVVAEPQGDSGAVGGSLGGDMGRSPLLHQEGEHEEG